MDCHIQLLDNVGKSPNYHHTNEIPANTNKRLSSTLWTDVLLLCKREEAITLPQPDIGPCVRFIRLVHLQELKGVGGGLREFARLTQLPHQRQEVVMVATVVKHLCRETEARARNGWAWRVELNEPICPTNSTLMPWCSSFLPFRLMCTFPATLSPSKNSGSFSFLPSSFLTSTFFLRSESLSSIASCAP